ncbi:MAG: hypothetical protein HPY76_14845, partial [Anaerolineae bacterium]|nr:hypothetical protein [Anaerolineae bacterium]
MRNKPHIRNRYVLLGDLFLIPVAVFASYILRLEPGPALRLYLPSAIWMVALALLIKPFVYAFFGLYRRLWLYASVQELKLITTAVTAASLLLAIPLVSLFALGVFTGFPRSVLVIDWLLSILLGGGLRFAIRL